MRGPPADRSIPELLSFGVVNLDKPAGPSAHEVAGWVRDACDDALASGDLGSSSDDEASAGDAESVDDAESAGDEEPAAHSSIERAAHGGTLDPKVTGCLPILLGDATRVARVLHRGQKEYVAVLELHASPPADLEATVAEFVGPLYQKPPRKSAVNRELRVREVYELEVLEVRERRALLRIACEAGTYVRKLCHDLGLALGTGAHMGHLRRVGTTPFDDRDLVVLQDLVDALAYAEEPSPASEAAGASNGDSPPIDVRDVVAPAERALQHLPAVTIAHSAAREVAEGAPVYAPGVLEVDAELGDGAASGDDVAVEFEGSSAGAVDGDAASDSADDGGSPLVACYTPDGAAVCLGRLVGDPGASEGTVVDLERVLV